MRSRHLLVLLAVAFLVAAIAAPAGAAVKRPRSGAQFEGLTAQQLPVTLRVTGSSVEYISFRFECGPGRTAVTGLPAIGLRKTRRGYRFGSRAHGIMSVSDDSPDENARVTVSGRFSRTGRSVKGTVRVRSQRCGDTGAISWRARR